MNPLTYARAPDVRQAIELARKPGSAYLGGGTHLLDLMKQGVAQPIHLVDVGRLASAEDAVVLLADGGVRIGAASRNSDVADHPLVRRQHPLLSQALLSGASAQLRNMATIGGNLMQRTRCHYFYDTGFSACNKRQPGSGCGAREGHNRIHAILGASEQCVATHPSDMNVALAALQAVVQVQGPAGPRQIAMANFHRLPGDTPERDTELAPGELITAVDIPPNAYSTAYHYLKVRDRASYAFALVSVAVGLDLRDGVVRGAGLALGGVAHKPWRVAAAEDALTGRALSERSIDAASKLLLAGARPLKYNAFKLPLAERCVARALKTAAGMI